MVESSVIDIIFSIISVIIKGVFSVPFIDGRPDLSLGIILACESFHVNI